MLLASATCVFARPQLRDLNIQVVVEKNGDARITETRTMDIDSEGTECYIVIGNLNGCELRDFGVSDETGQTYEYLGSWDIDRSRGYKTNKCGIVTKHDGYELCWGLGENGSRTYTTRYTITRLVKGYSDADGFNYMFVAQGMSPSDSPSRQPTPPDWLPRIRVSGASVIAATSTWWTVPSWQRAASRSRAVVR